MSDLTLADLVRNGTMSPAVAATLATAATERRSFVMVAIPRLAGKSTTMNATLAYAPEGTPMHVLSEEHGESLGIPEEGDGGYLLVGEIADHSFATYLWGAPVRQVFASLERGFSLATALHAGGVEEAFEVICGQNGVPDEHAGRVDLVVYIRSLGDDWRNPTGRRIATVHEVERVEDGRPRARLLHRWNEDVDRFEDVEVPRVIGNHSSTFFSFRTEFEAATRG